MNTVSWISYEQVLDQSLHILGRLWSRGVVGRQLDERGQKVLAFLHVFLHFLPDTNTHVNKKKKKRRGIQNLSEPTRADLRHHRDSADGRSCGRGRGGAGDGGGRDAGRFGGSSCRYHGGGFLRRGHPNGHGPGSGRHRQRLQRNKHHLHHTSCSTIMHSISCSTSALSQNQEVVLKTTELQNIWIFKLDIKFDQNQRCAKTFF